MTYAPPWRSAQLPSARVLPALRWVTLADFAAQLDAEFATEQPDEFDPPRASHLFGIPWNLSVGAGWGRRLFNSADDRVIVPHALGWAGH